MVAFCGVETTEDTVLQAFAAIEKFVATNGPCAIVRDYSLANDIHATPSRFVEGQSVK